MACFLVPGTEAVVTTMVKRHVDRAASARGVAAEETHVSWSRRLSWLNTMLWGGSGLLMLEHIWHGEVTFAFPFLTAMGNPADTMAMLHEMATAGVSMALLVTAVWACGCAAVELWPRLGKAVLGEEA